MNSIKYDYEIEGVGYSTIRQTEPRIAAYITKALGNARTVLNVGAGTGSYEPQDRYVVAVEPSSVMRSQRPKHLSPAVTASAESLPFDDAAFEASMAILTVHHWSDLSKGLLEMRRVTSGQVIIVTFDTDVLSSSWFAQYVPEFVEVERKRCPAIITVTDVLGGVSRIESIPVPFVCIDGIQEAYYGRPEGLLDQRVRRCQSIWGVLPEGVEERFVKDLSGDLASGEWDSKYGYFRQLPQFECALRLITNLP